MIEAVQTIWRKLILICQTQPLTVGLFAGLVVLTVVLLVVMRTKFGQTRPLWTCAILSVLAHILLIAYAYGIQLTTVATSSDPDDVVNFRLIDTHTENVEFDLRDQSVDSKLPENPWEQMPLEEISDTEPEQLPDAVPSEQSEFKFDIEPPELSSESVVSQPIQSDLSTQISNFDSEIPVTSNLTPVQPSAIESTIEAAPLEIEPRAPVETPSNFVENHDSPNHDSLNHDSLNTESEQIELPPPDISPEDFHELEMAMPEIEPIEPFKANQEFQSFVEQPTNVEANVEKTTPLTEALQSSTWRNHSENSSQPVVRAASSKTRSADGKPLPAIYEARTAEKNKDWLIEAGGSEQTEQAVEDALQFLSNYQEEDGRWDASRFGGGLERHTLGHDRQGAGRQADTAVTALSLLAFMAAGNTHLDGEYAKAVQKGLEFLLASQAGDGNLGGEALIFSKMYCHSMATLAISEAYAMTGDERLKPAVERAINYSLRCQNPNDGGWRYHPGQSGDMSQFGWHVMAMKSARLGGIEIPETSWSKMKMFLQRCTSGREGGLASYRPGQQPTAAMTAEALVCRYFLQSNPRPGAIREASLTINGKRPGSGVPNFYYWYYGTLAMKMTGGTAWDQWNSSMKSTLLKLQRQDGNLKGSYDPNGLWSGYGGRIYSTAMATLCLESYYRYLPAMKTSNNR